MELAEVDDSEIVSEESLAYGYYASVSGFP